MTSLRVLGLHLTRSQSGDRTTFFSREREFLISIDELRITTSTVPGFSIIGGSSYNPIVFQWEYEGDGVGRFRRLKNVPLSWVSSNACV